MQDYDNLQSFLEHVSLTTSADQEWEGEKVNLMTMHAAKDLSLTLFFYQVGKRFVSSPKISTRKR